jgi:hypothetical protein
LVENSGRRVPIACMSLKFGFESVEIVGRGAHFLFRSSKMKN